MEGVFLGVLQDLREDACAGVSFLIKLQALILWLCFKGRLWRGCFSRGFCEISGGAFSAEHLRKAASVFDSNILKMDLAIFISY